MKSVFIIVLFDFKLFYFQAGIVPNKILKCMSVHKYIYTHTN